MRSFELNDEASLNVYDATFAAHMTEVFERDLTNCTAYSLRAWQNRSACQRFAEIVVLPFRSQL
jgi:cardiolipin synthase